MGEAWEQGYEVSSFTNIAQLFQVKTASLKMFVTYRVTLQSLTVNEKSWNSNNS